MGTGPSSHSNLLPFHGNFGVFRQVFEILESDMCQGNFAMALCSFGVVNDQCGAKSCVGQETRMRPLLSSILT